MNKTLLALGLSLAFAGAASATTITPVNTDSAGSGLNDPTEVAPVGGNLGTTVGQQRQIAYQFAADLWEVILDSNVEIKVEASFQPLSCNATSGVLGSAGAKSAWADFPNAVPDTLYGNALANALAGTDLSSGVDDDNEIYSRFNANLGQTNCLAGSGWYYGLDGNTPSGMINFLDVVMHEIGHGLNFQGFYSLTTGAGFAGYADIYSLNVLDGNTGIAWTDLTDAQRVTAAISNNLVWTGANVTAEAPAVLGAVHELRLMLPNRPAAFPMVTAGYGPLADAANFSAGQIVRGRDAAGTSFGCAAFPAGAYTGKTVLLDRGNCAFTIKTKNAQNAGATKVIVAYDEPTGFPGMGGSDATVTIPSIGITRAAGNAIKKSISLGVRGGLVAKPGEFSGVDSSGRVRLYSPNPVAGGSSFSHFDTSLTPNALMEPFINDSLNSALELDLTPALFEDLGWTLVQ